MIETIVKQIIGYLIPLICGFLIAKINNFQKKDKSYIESLKCLLRASMVNTYFAYKEIGTMPYYCKQSWYLMYEQYKNLGGNSFIDDIKLEIDNFEIKK